MFFYAAMAVFYCLLMCWFGCMMGCYRASRIPIEKWIQLTIVISLLEMFFRFGDAFVWNQNGRRTPWITFSAIGIGVFKGAFSRSLMVMVSLGWGVTRDSLGRKYKWIFILGLAFIGLSLARNLMIVIAVDHVEELSASTESTLYDVSSILAVALGFVDVIYAMWIYDALSATMEQLGRRKQLRKLKRYSQLRCSFILAVLFAFAWVVYTIVSKADPKAMVQEQDVWIVKAAVEINYGFLLLGVACLWRPSKDAKDYAYSMELASDPDGIDPDGLELKDSDVPSAMDDFYYDP
jgi:hypothetical protein